MGVGMTNLQSLIAIIAVAFTTLVASQAHAGPVEVHDTFLKYGTKNYFIAGADTVQLGAYGEKKSPVGKANYLEVQDQLPGGKLDGKIKSVSIVTIDFANEFKAATESAISGLKVVEVGSSVSYEKLKSGHLKLVHLVILAGDVKNAVNGSPAALRNLESYGSDARIAHEIFVVLEATTADKLVAGTDFNVTGTVEGIKISASGEASTSRPTTVTLSPGTTFAYLLVKLDWNKGKTKLDKCTDDMAHSLN